MSEYPKVRRVIVSLCEACIKGEGKMCHTPDCVMCRHLVDIPFMEELLEDADSVLGDLVRQRDEAESVGEVWKREVDYWRRLALQAGETIQRQDATRQRDALDGQAALDEANNRIVALEKAATDVVWFDWSDNDADAVRAIARLRGVLKGRNINLLSRPEGQLLALANAERAK